MISRMAGQTNGGVDLVHHVGKEPSAVVVVWPRLVRKAPDTGTRNHTLSPNLQITCWIALCLESYSLVPGIGEQTLEFNGQSFAERFDGCFLLYAPHFGSMGFIVRFLLYCIVEVMELTIRTLRTMSMVACRQGSRR